MKKVTIVVIVSDDTAERIQNEWAGSDQVLFMGVATELFDLQIEEHRKPFTPLRVKSGGVVQCVEPSSVRPPA